MARTARRKTLPISQRHRPECRRPRQCDCPWSFRMVMPDDSMTRVTKPTWDEAEAAWRDLKSTVKGGGPLPDKTTTVAQWADRWLEAGDRRPDTITGHRSTINLYIKPHFGDSLVIAVQPDQVRLWVARLHQQGPVGKQARDGNAAIGKAVKLLHAMFAQWQKDRRYLPYGNPVDSGLAPDPPPKMFTPLTVAEVHRLAAAMPPEAALAAETEAFFGPRVSEVLGLREEDFTFTGKDPAAPLGPQLAALARLSTAEYEARRPRIRFGRRVNRSRQTAPMKNRRGYRFLPFPQHMAAAYAAQLAAWPAAGGWVFVNREWRCKPPQPRGAGPYRRATRRRPAGSAGGRSGPPGRRCCCRMRSRRTCAGSRPPPSGPG